MKLRNLAILLLVFPLAGCHGPQSILNPGGPAASSLSQVGWVTFILFSVVAFITLVILLWAILRSHGSLDTHLPWTEGGGIRWILIGGFIIPVIVLCGIFVFALVRTSHFPLEITKNIHPEIEVIGHQWWWEVHYIGGPLDTHFITANEIHIPVGRPIDFELKSADVLHSFWVPGLHGKMEMIPGKPNFIRMIATRAGNFPGQCSMYCGAQHAHMRLLVVAQPPDEYKAWLAQQLKPAAQPQGVEAVLGRSVFLHAECALCHTIRGTGAGGKVAPDLTHLASRQMIASDSYANDTANLEAWVTHAQSLKPECEMPDITAFTGNDLVALVTYLQQLK
ncbi:MAG: cytochrome c oxidase subunit II [Terriglobia bacterium]